MRLWAMLAHHVRKPCPLRLANLRRTVQSLHGQQVPVALVELASPGRHECRPEWADLYLPITRDIRGWQRGALIRILARRLPPEAEFACWIDSDVLLLDPDWPQQAIDLLSGPARVCQLFTRMILETEPGQFETSVGFAHRLRSGILTPHGTVGGKGCGYGWAASRDWWAAGGLYIAPTSADDTLSAYAYADLSLDPSLIISPAMLAHWQRWAESFSADISGIANLQGDAFHLWHGSWSARRSRSRRHLEILARERFDPERQLTTGSDGLLEWTEEGTRIVRSLETL